ncbi:hypothetical protein E2C01_005023 [Portunus trituberculatus]|uniref:Uncharacterized protein n=1 Tax=Portunus trituberculatus TaxID=210409 RepID=A0A5B7CSW6_PORTR|nr:hypothetical protein [Portunus trituberculatus]
MQDTIHDILSALYCTADYDNALFMSAVNTEALLKGCRVVSQPANQPASQRTAVAASHIHSIKTILINQPLIQIRLSVCINSCTNPKPPGILTSASDKGYNGFPVSYQTCGNDRRCLTRGDEAGQGFPNGEQ